MIKQIKRKINRPLRSFRFIWNHPVGRKNRLRALGRYTLFHLRHWIKPDRAVYPFISGTSFLAKTGDAGVSGNVYVGLDDFESMSFLLHFLRPGDLFLDVGANFGTYSILASGVCAANSIAFEPNKDSYEVLEKNIDINNIKNLVKLNCLGVGKVNTMAYFTKTLGALNHIMDGDSFRVSEEIDSIQLTTLDDYMDYETSNSIWWKIDVEGYEYEVLSGAMNRLKDPRLKGLFIETNGWVQRYGNTVNEVHKLLTGNKFSPYLYHTFERILTPLKGPAELNTIYIRDLDFVLERIKKSSKYQVYGVGF